MFTLRYESDKVSRDGNKGVTCLANYPKLNFIGCTFARKDPNGFVKQAFSEDSGMAIGLHNIVQLLWLQSKRICKTGLLGRFRHGHWFAEYVARCFALMYNVDT